jgi:hypothetical protein
LSFFRDCDEDDQSDSPQYCKLVRTQARKGSGLCDRSREIDVGGRAFLGTEEARFRA